MFTLEFLKDIARLCSLSYDKQEKIVENFTNSRPYNFTDNELVFYKCSQVPKIYSSENDCQVYVSKYEDYLSICFRGTESFSDILMDLQMSKTQFPLINREEQTWPYVHTGFYKQFEAVRNELDREIENYHDELNEDTKIIFSGHSLGGALATLSSLYYAVKYPKIEVNCVTFGSPRVGCDDFASLFNKKITNSYRYVNDNDPVPCVPTSIRFRHVNGLRWLNQDKVENSIGVWRFYRFLKNTLFSLFGLGYNALEDHSCDGYIRDLSIMVKNERDEL